MRILPSDISPTNWLLGCVEYMQEDGNCFFARQIVSRLTLLFGSTVCGLASSAYHTVALIKTPIAILQIPLCCCKIPKEFTMGEMLRHAFKVVGYVFSAIISPFLGLISPEAVISLHKALGLKTEPNEDSEPEDDDPIKEFLLDPILTKEIQEQEKKFEEFKAKLPKMFEEIVNMKIEEPEFSPIPINVPLKPLIETILSSVRDFLKEYNASVKEKLSVTIPELETFRVVDSHTTLETFDGDVDYFTNKIASLRNIYYHIYWLVEAEPSLQGKLNEKSKIVDNNLGSLFSMICEYYLSKGNLEECVRLFRNSPDCAQSQKFNVLLRVVQSYLVQKQIGKARGILEKDLNMNYSLSDEDKLKISNMTKVVLISLCIQGKYNEALKAIKTLIPHDSSGFIEQLNEAICAIYLNKNDLKNAEDLIQKMGSHQEAKGYLSLILAEVYLKENNLKKAYEISKCASDVNREKLLLIILEKALEQGEIDIASSVKVDLILFCKVDIFPSHPLHSKFKKLQKKVKQEERKQLETGKL